MQADTKNISIHFRFRDFLFLGFLFFINLFIYTLKIQMDLTERNAFIWFGLSIYVITAFFWKKCEHKKGTLSMIDRFICGLASGLFVLFSLLSFFSTHLISIPFSLALGFYLSEVVAYSLRNDLKFESILRFIVPPTQFFLLGSLCFLIGSISISVLCHNVIWTHLWLSTTFVIYVLVVYYTYKHPSFHEKYDTETLQAATMKREGIDMSRIVFYTPYRLATPCCFATLLWTFLAVLFAIFLHTKDIWFYSKDISLCALGVLMIGLSCQLAIALWSKSVYDKYGSTFKFKEK